MRIMSKVKQITDLAKIIVLGNTEPVVKSTIDRLRRTKNKIIDVLTDW